MEDEDWSDSSESCDGIPQLPQKREVQLKKPSHFSYKDPQNIPSSLIDVLSSDTGMSKSQSRLFLANNNWDILKVINLFENGNLPLPDYPLATPSPEVRNCRNCLNKNQIELITLDCNHVICIICCNTHLQSSLDSEASCVNLKCIACEELFPAECINYLEDEYKNIYNNLLLSSIRKSCRLVQCQKKDCELYNYLYDIGIQEFECECGTSICSKCGHSGHELMSCEDIRFWLKAVPEKGVTFLKACPFCSEIVDQNFSFFSCMCGQEYCIRCFKSKLNHSFPCEDLYGTEYQIDYLILKGLENNLHRVDWIEMTCEIYNLYLQLETELLQLLANPIKLNLRLSENSKSKFQELYQYILRFPRKLAYLYAGSNFYRIENYSLIISSLRTINLLFKTIIKEYKSLIEQSADTFYIMAQDSALEQIKKLENHYNFILLEIKILPPYN